MGIIYFAYGSNMLTARLRNRCSGATPVGWAVAKGYRLEFSKKSKDHSAKATLVSSVGDEAYGALFEIPATQLRQLDLAEGGGYKRHNNFELSNSEGVVISSLTYLAIDRETGLLPYDWYKDHIVEGARIHGLPAEYIAKLHALPSQPDRVDERKKTEEAWRKFS